MKLFVAMPFAAGYQPIYDVIKSVSSRIALEPIRMDETCQPGVAAQQMIDELATSDFVVADVSNGNPNVFYEVALAHCAMKPTLLISKREAVDSLPFDIRHNRVLAYEDDDLEGLEKGLSAHLEYLIEHHGNNGSRPPLNTFFSVLADNRIDGVDVIQGYIREIAREFALVDARLLESKFISGTEGFLITIGDAFEERVVFSVDSNGNVRRKKRLD